MITGLNHLTLAVNDLDVATKFYRDVLGFNAKHVWADGAYLEAGTLWLCLTVCDTVERRSDYTHVAFDVAAADFSAMAARLETSNVSLWRENVSEGESVYFLDPDGHKLELHAGDLASRLQSIVSASKEA